MSDVGFAQPVHTPRSNGEMATYGNDNSLIVNFYREKVHMTFLSEQQGRQIFEEQDYIHIIVPGGKTDIKRRVKEKMPMGSPIPSDPERFPRQWTAFKNKQEQAQSGTPIEEFAPMPSTFRDEFKACRIHTVEQLAGLHDGNAERMPLEWRKWRDKAQVWMQKASDNAPLMALQSENETLKADLQGLKDQMTLFMQAQQEPAKRGPGRPPKTEE